MLQKAVDIHFDLNYKHLCNSPTDLKVLDNEISSPNNVPHQTKKCKYKLIYSLIYFQKQLKTMTKLL